PLEECFYFLPHRCTPVFQILRAVLVSVSTSVLYTLMMSGRAAAPLTSMPPLPEPAWAIICEVPTSLACPRSLPPLRDPAPTFCCSSKLIAGIANGLEGSLMTTKTEAAKNQGQTAEGRHRTQDLRDKIAVVTGASSGIGRAIALSLAEEGTQLCLVGRRLDALENVCHLARDRASAVHAFRADLTREEDIQALAAELSRSLGRVDILVHSAGEIRHAELSSAPVSDLDLQYHSNVRGPYLLTQELLPLLRIGPGQIAFINSSSGLRARARTGQFAA